MSENTWGNIAPIQIKTAEIENKAVTFGKLADNVNEYIDGKVDKELKTDSESEYKVLTDNNFTDGYKATLEGEDFVTVEIQNTTYIPYTLKEGSETVQSSCVSGT